MTCYEKTQQYSRAETLARQVVQQYPNNLEFRVKLAEMLIQQDKTDEGAQAYRDAIGSLEQSDNRQCLTIIASLVQHGLGEIALEVIDSIRVTQAAPSLLAMERGSGLEQQLRYGEAAYEYIDVVDEDTTANSGKAESRLMKLLAFADSSEEVERALLELADGANSLGAAKVLASYYIKSGRLDDAFDFAV